MFQKHYAALERKRRLAEKAKQGEASVTADWHQWGFENQPRDVGNLTRTQLLAYLNQQRKEGAAK